MSPMIKTPLALEHALLGFLQEGPVHPYEMHQILMLSEPLGRVWHVKQSRLYALLVRLEEEGYVRAEITAHGSRPPRKMLHLTPEGRSAFAAWLVTPVAHSRDFRIEFLVKLFFAAKRSPEQAKSLIDAQRRATQSWLHVLSSQASIMDEHGTYEHLVLEFRTGQTEAILAWLDKCEATLAVPMV